MSVERIAEVLDQVARADPPPRWSPFSLTQPDRPQTTLPGEVLAVPVHPGAGGRGDVEQGVFSDAGGGRT
jgi:hypothetical protein